MNDIKLKISEIDTLINRLFSDNDHSDIVNVLEESDTPVSKDLKHYLLNSLGFEPIKLLIEVEGGLVQEVTTNSNLEIEVAVKDWDESYDSIHKPKIDSELVNNTFNDIHYQSI